MGRRHRHRRISVRQSVKWTGAAATVLLLAVWIGSAWWGTGITMWPMMLAEVHAGQLEIWTRDPIEYSMGAPTWHGLERHTLAFGWWFDARSSGPSRMSAFSNVFTRAVEVPLWPLVMLTGVLTGWMFRTDRKHRHGERAGLCATCGYNLRGQREAVSHQLSAVSEEFPAESRKPRADSPLRCPECGERKADAASRGTLEG